MMLKRRLSLFLSVIMLFTAIQTYPASGKAMDLSQAWGESFGKQKMDLEESDQTPTEPDVTPEVPGFEEVAELKDLKLSYDEKKDKITLTYQAIFWDYFMIFVNDKVVEDDYKGCAYDYDDIEEGQNYVFRVVPYSASDVAGKGSEISFQVPFKKAVIEEVDADYNLEKQVLILDWSGDDISYADVYQDDVLIAKKVTDRRLISEMALEPKSKHTYRVVPFNKNDEEGEAKSFLLEVDDYVARIDQLFAEYNETTKQIQLNWTDSYTQYVEISLNDEALAEKFTGKNFVISCDLQPGASYIVTVLPYNYKGEEGESEEEDVSFGYFDVPESFSASLINIPVQNKSGYFTGFSRPSIRLSWEAQNRAVYEIYRAEEKDVRSAYKWIANVRSNVDGQYIYMDEKAGFGNYYYKIRRKIVTDPYVDQELYTALSDAENVRFLVPKPELKVELSEKGKILLSMNSGREFVSGYEIYRKCNNGKFKHLATITDDEYTDNEIEFEKTYHYKVKAYYYDVSSGKKTEGKFSKVSKVKNSISGIQVTAEAVSSDTVKVSWTPAANVKKYEVYYKSGMPGDSYVLWKTTDSLELSRKVNKNGTYYFMVKANQTSENGKTYFSSAETFVKMGFSAPSGISIAKTTYEKNKKTNVLIQKDVISWNAVYGAKGYYVEVYNDATKKYKRVAKIRSKVKTTYTVKNSVTENAQTKKYRISAYSGKRVKKGSVVEIVPMLGSVKGVKAVEKGSKVKISWKKVTGAERYQVYRSNGRTMLLVGETSGSSILDQGLSVGIPYKYYVQALNRTQKITGEKSLPVDFMTKRNAITGFKAVNTSSGSVHLSWNPDKEATGYRIYFKKSKDGKYQKLADVDAKTKLYVHKNLAAGTNCYYKITAVLTNCGGIAVESDGDLAEVKVSK